MSEAALTPPPEGTRSELIEYFRALLATPRTHADFAELRRRGRDGLTLLGAPPVARGLARRRVCLVSTHFRAPRPKGRLKRI